MKIKRILTLLLLSLLLMLAGATSVYAAKVEYYNGGKQEESPDGTQEADRTLDLTDINGDTWWLVTQIGTKINNNRITGNGTVNLIFSGDGGLLVNDTLTLDSGVTLKLFYIEDISSSSYISIEISDIESQGGSLYLGSGNLNVKKRIKGTNVTVNAGNGMLTVSGSNSTEPSISLEGSNSVTVSSGTLFVSANNEQTGISAEGNSSIEVSGGLLRVSTGNGPGISLGEGASISVTGGELNISSSRNSGISLTGTGSINVSNGGILSVSSFIDVNAYAFDLSGGSLIVSDGGIVEIGLAGAKNGLKASGSSSISLSGGSTLQISVSGSDGTALTLSDYARLTVNNSYFNASASSGGTSISKGSNISVDDGATGIFFLSPAPAADLDGITEAENPEFGALVFTAQNIRYQWEGTAYGSVNVPKPGFELNTDDNSHRVLIGQKPEGEDTNSNYPVTVIPNTTAEALSIPEGASLSASSATTLGQVEVNLGSASEIKGGNQYAYTDGSKTAKGGQLKLDENITLNGTTINNAGTITVDGFTPSDQGYTINNGFYGDIDLLNAYNGSGDSDILKSVGQITNIDELKPNSGTNKITYPVFFDVSKPDGTGAKITDLAWNDDKGYYTLTKFNGPDGSPGPKGINTYIYGEELPLPGKPGTAGSGVVATDSGFKFAGWSTTKQQALTDMVSNPTFEWPLGSTKVPPVLYLFGQVVPTLDDSHWIATGTNPIKAETLEHNGTATYTFDCTNNLSGTVGNYEISWVVYNGGPVTGNSGLESLSPAANYPFTISVSPEGPYTPGIVSEMTVTLTAEGNNFNGQKYAIVGYFHPTGSDLIPSEELSDISNIAILNVDIQKTYSLTVNIPDGGADKAGTVEAVGYPADYALAPGGTTLTYTYYIPVSDYDSDRATVTLIASPGKLANQNPDTISWTSENDSTIPHSTSGKTLVASLLSSGGVITVNFTLNQEGGGGSGGEPTPPVYYSVQASVSPAGAGTVNGSASFSQSYAAGSPATLRAIPSSGWHFSGWSQNGTIVSRDNPMTVTVNSNLSYVALFVRNTIITPSVTFTPSSLTLTQGQTGTVKVAVSPQAGYVPSVSSSNSEVATASYNTATGEIIVKTVGPGKCQIMVYVGGTTAAFSVTVEALDLEDIIITPSPVYLAAKKGEGFVNSRVLGLTSVPKGIDLSDAKVTVSPTSVATVKKNDQGQWTVTAVKDGTAEITVTMEDVAVKVPVVVSSEKAVINMERTTITVNSPDFYTVTVAPMVNPAVPGADSSEIRKVSLFTWSQVGQTDIDCKVANDNGNGTWSYTFPVNNTPVNNYYLDASDIIVQAYASTDSDSDGNMVMNTTWNYADCGWTDSVIVTPYVQNQGFIIPSVGQGAVAGTTGNHVQMEGVRISTPIEGLDIIYDVHAQDLGWMDQVSEGVYAGTMHANLQIEAIHIRLTGTNASKYSIQYQAHVENLGWMPWVQNGAQAGTTGRNLQLEALRIRIVPAGTDLPSN